MTTNPIQLLLVDDHSIVRQGLKQLLELDGSLKVIGEAENGEEAIAKAFALKPDIILLDVNLPKINGYEAAKAILTAWGDAKIIILTNQDDTDVIKKFLDLAIKGFLLKDVELDKLIAAITTVYHGGKVALTADLEERVQRAKSVQKHHTPDSLTEREEEVLKALSKGYSNQQLAELLCVSPKTVHNHLYNIYSKIGVSSRAEAIVWALESGFLK